jgi:NAD(P)-dependent dehydrogenase (short-subunit alcohol dehydrogenase family)
MVDLKGKVAIVTGAGGGLGRDYALALASAGAKVLVNDYGGTYFGVRGDQTRAEQVVEEIKSRGGEALANAADVSKPEEVKAMVNQAVEAWSTVHILINNAGVITYGTPDNISESEHYKAWATSLLSSVMATSYLWPFMVKQKWGRIVNTSSAAIYGFDIGSDASYAASKGAVLCMTKEMGLGSDKKFNIKVNCVLPEAASRMNDLSPMLWDLTNKYGFQPSRVAAFVLALCSDECPVSGEAFNVGGGRAARTTFIGVPGHIADTADGYLENFDKVLGKIEDAFIQTTALEAFRYSIAQVSGSDPGPILMSPENPAEETAQAAN